MSCDGRKTKACARAQPKQVCKIVTLRSIYGSSEILQRLRVCVCVYVPQTSRFIIIIRIKLAWARALACAWWHVGKWFIISL